jgi:transcription elongation factor Elf1
MKSIKVTSNAVHGQLTTACSVKQGVMVGSVHCQNCKSFEGYDEGKGIKVLCSDEYQQKGSYVHG